MFDLHRHDEFSSYDGFGNAKQLAKLTVDLGYKSLCTTNHGNVNGLVKTYTECRKLNIKPILGCEGYFIPKYKEKHRGYHLILLAKNYEGYKNLNRLQYEGEKQKYYNPIWTFELLKKYSAGLICTTACVASYTSKAILADKIENAEKCLRELDYLFGYNLYVEIQPYPISEKGAQERVNVEMLKLARKLHIKPILTSDSHRGAEEDFDTYLIMHEMAGHDVEQIEETYKDRYMPRKPDMARRFIKMHEKDYGREECKKLAHEMYENLTEIENKCSGTYLDDLPMVLPNFTESEKESKKLIKSLVINGLKKRGKYKPEYIERCKKELKVINYHGFEVYFLIVADYVSWARSNNIIVGPGRGSVCNSLVAYALGITEVDSLLFNLDFRRFLREDKKKFPDIDLDFMPSRRAEVIEYICNKYKGQSARVASYGLYKTDNLVNDLSKVCGLMWIDDNGHQQFYKDEIKQIKAIVNKYIDDIYLNVEAFENDSRYDELNNKYNNIMKHIGKLYGKMRFIGTHAAGVAITGGDILDYTSLRIDQKTGDLYTSYDLYDLESIGVMKFDILGLKTMESLGELRKLTGVSPNYDTMLNDALIYNYFREGRTDGVFQFESKTAKEILKNISCDCFADVVAANAMNRPGPLKLGQPQDYANNKFNLENAKLSPWYEYAKDTYGTVIYQEQVQRIVVDMAGLTWQDADLALKLIKGNSTAQQGSNVFTDQYKDLKNKFILGMVANGHDKDLAVELFENITNYSFNQGHATGYSLISLEEMFFKVYYPNEFWFSKIKYARDLKEFERFNEFAVYDGSVVFLPHVNYSGVKTTLRKVEGENVIQQGLSDVKNVGEKAAQYIIDERKANGIFKSYDDFYDRCKSRVVTSRVVETLKDQGALEFKKPIYVNRVKKYNSALYSRGARA